MLIVLKLHHSVYPRAHLKVARPTIRSDNSQRQQLMRDEFPLNPENVNGINRQLDPKILDFAPLRIRVAILPFQLGCCDEFARNFPR